METKNCPYCGGEIMSVARKCKHCGRWLEDTQKLSSPTEPVKSTAKLEEVEIRQSNSKKIIWFILAAIVMAIVIWIITVVHEKSEWERTLRENHVIGSVVDDTHSFDIQILTCAKTEYQI